jgi:metal-responsive CopG/Arc/MetJ family transcriptional regulator
MPRVRTAISLQSELLDKIDKYLETNIKYKDRSHFFEVIANRFFDSLEEMILNASAANLKTCSICENLFPGTLLECPKCGHSEQINV